MSQENDSAGIVVTIPAKSFLLVTSPPLKEGQVSTGIIKLCQLSGGQTTLRVEAVSEEKGPDKKLAGKEDGRLSGIVEQAYVDIERKYSLGCPPLDIRIGESPTFPSQSGGFDLHLGNYGIIHRISLEVENASNMPRNASVFYIASGGPARVFIADGMVIQTKLLDPKGTRSERIMSVLLSPGEKRIISIEMMPEPGSFYPTRLVVLEEKS
jgi:hypothetical protein